MIQPLFMLSLAAMLGGCAGLGSAPQGADAVKDSGIDVAIGQRAYVDGPIVEPVSILEDSRCPPNVDCVWAGRLRLQMIWHRGNGEAMPFIAEYGSPTHLADGSFSIIATTPRPGTDQPPLKPEQYRFSFRFDGGI